MAVEAAEIARNGMNLILEGKVRNHKLKNRVDILEKQIDALEEDLSDQQDKLEKAYNKQTEALENQLDAFNEKNNTIKIIIGHYIRQSISKLDKQNKKVTTLYRKIIEKLKNI